MKDIKLTIEEIKKGCEFAEGYTILGDGTLQFSNGDYFRKYVLYSGEWEYNKLGDFLQRVIEGINKNPMKIDEPHFRIRMNCDIDNQWYEVSHGRVLADGHSYITFMFKNNDSIDQAKTQAIKYILDKLK